MILKVRFFDRPPITKSVKIPPTCFKDRPTLEGRIKQEVELLAWSWKLKSVTLKGDVPEWAKFFSFGNNDIEL